MAHSCFELDQAPGSCWLLLETPTAHELCPPVRPCKTLLLQVSVPMRLPCKSALKATVYPSNSQWNQLFVLARASDSLRSLHQWLCRSVYLDRMQHGDGVNPQRLCEHDPQLPQGFTPLSEPLRQACTSCKGAVTPSPPDSLYRCGHDTAVLQDRVVPGPSWSTLASQHSSITVCRIRPGDWLRASCDFSSAETNHVVRAGASHHDEMCNLYMMVSSELPYFMSCNGGMAAVSGRGAGGIPAPARLEADRHAAWRPPQQASACACPTI